MVSSATLQILQRFEVLSLQETIGCNYSMQTFVVNSSYKCNFTWFKNVAKSAISKIAITFGSCTVLS